MKLLNTHVGTVGVDCITISPWTVKQKRTCHFNIEYQEAQIASIIQLF